MSFIYSDITALVTGASSGIGRAFAIELAKRGCNLVLVARSREKLESLANQLEQDHNIDVLVIIQDLSLENAAKNVFTQTQHAGKDIHLLINNAGFGDDKSFADVDFDTQQTMTRLNVTAVSDLAHLYLPKMLEQRRGGIINVASIVSFAPFPYMTVYAATKAFVLSFSQGLWAECRRQGVHVLALCPGDTATSFFADMDMSADELKGMDQPSDVAKMGLAALEQNRSYIITNKRASLLISLLKFLPRTWVLRLLGRINTPESSS